MGMFEKAVKKICDICSIGAAFSIVALVVLILSEIVLRRLFNLSLLVVEELVGYLLSTSIFLALAPTFRDGAMIRLTLVVNRLDKRSASVLEILTSGLALCITIFLARYVLRAAWRFYDRGIASNGVWPIPLWIPEVFALLGLVSLSLVLILHIFSRVVVSPDKV